MIKKAIQVVNEARSSKHITDQEIIHLLFPDFFELHGDRLHQDDPSIIGGLATFHRQPVMVITTSRGDNIKERLVKHFGQPEPSGYRKALRLCKQANKFKYPVFIFIDTSGAYPGKSAEENGQGQAIAQNLLKIGQLGTPIISIIYGEGGSGGALALACGDEVWMLENSTYSILSPEGFATIMWNDSTKAAQAAELLHLTPNELLKLKVIEGILPEPDNHQEVIRQIDLCLQSEIKKLQALSEKELLMRRNQRFRKF